MAQQLRNLRRILDRLRILLNQENPNELHIKVYCDCLDPDGHQLIAFPHLALDLSDFGCVALSSRSEDYLQHMVNVIQETLRARGEHFLPQVEFACPYKQALIQNLAAAAQNNLPPPPPPPPAPAED